VNPFQFVVGKHTQADTQLNVQQLVESWTDFVDAEQLEACKITNYKYIVQPVAAYLASESTNTQSESAREEDPCPEWTFAAQVCSEIGQIPALSGKPPRLFKQDEWKRGPNSWIRVHNRPRKALFVPTGTKNGPDIRTLSGIRATKINYCNSKQCEVVKDEWICDNIQGSCKVTNWLYCFPY
jgi:hypothetical protein